MIQTHTHGSVYYLRECIQCAATLVMSARPSRTHQEAMLAHVSRFWSRDAVLKEIENHG